MIAYSWRFNIEVIFRNLIQLLSGFSYQFWMKDMTQTQDLPKDMILSRYPKQQQQHFHRKLEAMERFVLIDAITLGVLQLLSLEMAMTVDQDLPRWFRTLPKN